MRLEIRPTAKCALETNTRIRLFLGAGEALGRAIVLEPSAAIAHGSSGLAQLVMQDPVVALAGDRFVIRDETSRRTLGGGVVLNPLGRRNRRPTELYRQRLAMLSDAMGAGCNRGPAQSAGHLRDAGLPYRDRTQSANRRD